MTATICRSSRSPFMPARAVRGGKSASNAKTTRMQQPAFLATAIDRWRTWLQGWPLTVEPRPVVAGQRRSGEAGTRYDPRRFAHTSMSSQNQVVQCHGRGGGNGGNLPSYRTEGHGHSHARPERCVRERRGPTTMNHQIVPAIAALACGGNANHDLRTVGVLGRHGNPPNAFPPGPGSESVPGFKVFDGNSGR